MEWQTVYEIDGNNDVVARVQRRGDIKPQYSVSLGRRRQDERDRLVIFVPVFGDNDILSYIELLQKADVWISEDRKQIAARRAALGGSAEQEDFGRENRRSNGRKSRPSKDRY